MGYFVKSFKIFLIEIVEYLQHVIESAAMSVKAYS